MLAKLTRTFRRHRAAIQGQARCSTQQIGSPPSLHCRVTTRAARLDLHRAEIAAAVRLLSSRDWLKRICGLHARNLLKQLFQYFEHDGVPVIDLVTLLFFLSRATNFAHGHRQEQCHRQPSSRTRCAGIAMGASQQAAVS
jgi:hypothetical protein